MKKFRTEYFPDFFFAKLNFVPTAHPMSTGDQPLIEVPQKIYPSANGSSVIFGSGSLYRKKTFEALNICMNIENGLKFQIGFFERGLIINCLFFISKLFNRQITSVENFFCINSIENSSIHHQFFACKTV